MASNFMASFTDFVITRAMEVSRLFVTSFVTPSALELILNQEVYFRV